MVLERSSCEWICRVTAFLYGTQAEHHERFACQTTLGIHRVYFR